MGTYHDGRPSCRELGTLLLVLRVHFSKGEDERPERFSSENLAPAKRSGRFPPPEKCTRSLVAC